MSRLDALQRVVERAIGTQTPGLVVVVAANERLECVAGGAGITPDTRFPIGCIIKHLTAVSLLHHVERGSLSLDAAVSKILPELATNRRESSPITIRHLMSHNGGFIDPGEEGRWSMTWPQFADWFRDREQVYPPGAVWSYSQAGHVILSKVLEKLEEKDYAHAIEQALLNPLGIEADWSGGEVEAKAVATAHIRLPTTGRFAPLRPPKDLGVFKRSIGELTLTARDLARLGLALTRQRSPWSETLRSQATRQSIRRAPMWAPPNSERVFDSFGLATAGYGAAMGYVGSYIGSCVGFRIDPVGGAVVAVAANVNNAPLRDVFLKNALAGESSVQQDAPSPDATDLDLALCQGRYRGLMMGSGEAELVGDEVVITNGARSSRVALGRAGEHPHRLPDSSPFAVGFSRCPHSSEPVLTVGASAFKWSGGS